MPTRSLNLTDHFDRFIEAGIASGRFSDAGDVVGEGLRLLEQREAEEQAKIEWLRSAANEGFDAFDRGDFISIRSEAALDQFFDQIHQQATSELAAE